RRSLKLVVKAVYATGKEQGLTDGNGLCGLCMTGRAGGRSSFEEERLENRIGISSTGASLCRQ
ncbi:MAG: hypothetical protein J5863_03510, partial [Desulfovibrio sp.]|nr:hypothetical protein [Desulfovibrio sp.]